MMFPFTQKQKCWEWAVEAAKSRSLRKDNNTERDNKEAIQRFYRGKLGEVAMMNFLKSKDMHGKLGWVLGGADDFDLQVYDAVGDQYIIDVKVVRSMDYYILEYCENFPDKLSDFYVGLVHHPNHFEVLGCCHKTEFDTTEKINLGYKDNHKPHTMHDLNWLLQQLGYAETH